MKVSLIVVQGKPEGKVIPLNGPVFRVGRGDGMHLRPNNEQVSRRHTEIRVEEQRVVIRDLGSRNGTYVNNERLEAEADRDLRNKDLVQIGPLTFAVSIQGATVGAAAPGSEDKAEKAMAKAASLDELSGDQIDAWIVGEQDKEVTDRPSGVYSGDTQTFAAFKSQSDPAVPAQPPEAVDAAETEAEAGEDEAEAAAEPSEDDVVFDKLEDEEGGRESESDQEEFFDENNPFHSAKKEEPAHQQKAAAANSADSSRAAEDILRKMMERRRSGQ